MSHPFNIILPPRECFSRKASGAVGLVVAEQYAHSRFSDKTMIWGGPQAELIPGIPYKSISPSRFRLHGYTESYSRKLATAIPDSNETYMEVHNRANVFRLLRNRHTRSRIALYLHNDPEAMGGLETAMERRQILTMADAVICVSEYVRRSFMTGIDHGNMSKIHVIPNTLNMNSYARPGDAPPLRILYVGRMVPEKGVYPLAQALASTLPRYPDWQAEFIGASRHGSNATTALEKDIQGLLAPLGERVAWRGQLPNEAVQQHMRNASIVVVPSICNEAFGRVAIEAMANGCAVISSGRGGLPEATGPAALNVNPEDPVDIATALESLMSDPARLMAARSDGWEYVKAHFDIVPIASRLDDLRESLLELTA